MTAGINEATINEWLFLDNVHNCNVIRLTPASFVSPGGRRLFKTNA